MISFMALFAVLWFPRCEINAENGCQWPSITSGATAHDASGESDVSQGLFREPYSRLDNSERLLIVAPFDKAPNDFKYKTRVVSSSILLAQPCFRVTHTPTEST